MDLGPYNFFYKLAQVTVLYNSCSELTPHTIKTPYSPTVALLSKKALVEKIQNSPICGYPPSYHSIDNFDLAF